MLLNNIDSMIIFLFSRFKDDFADQINKHFHSCIFKQADVFFWRKKNVWESSLSIFFCILVFNMYAYVAYHSQNQKRSLLRYTYYSGWVWIVDYYAYLLEASTHLILLSAPSTKVLNEHFPFKIFNDYNNKNTSVCWTGFIEWAESTGSNSFAFCAVTAVHIREEIKQMSYRTGVIYMYMDIISSCGLGIWKSLVCFYAIHFH